MTAGQAFQAKIRAGAKHLPAITAAGMGLFHYQNIIQTNIHGYFPLMASQYCFAACSTLLGPYS